MADNPLLDVAVANLDELEDYLSATIKRGGFDPQHKNVMWMLKAWVKCAIQANHPDYHKLATAYFVMKRDPSPITGSRSKTLLRDIGSFKTVLATHRTTHGDFFNRVDVGMRDFVWEYRKRLAGKTGQEFEAKLMALMSMGKDGLMKEKLFKMDQHA
jgi:hypothetical protein